MSLDVIIALIGGLVLGVAGGLWAGRASLAAELRRVAQLARVDALTGLLNRRAFDEHLPKLQAVALRYGQVYSLILIDLDHFKSLNDRAGHPAGDAALRQIAAALNDQVREADRVFRVGGDEFAVLCPCTGAVGAAVLAERLRVVVATLPIQNVRFSAGIAETGGPSAVTNNMQSDIMRRADAALMISKRAGGDRVQMESDR